MRSQGLDMTGQLSTILFVAIIYIFIGHRANKNSNTNQCTLRKVHLGLKMKA